MDWFTDVVWRGILHEKRRFGLRSGPFPFSSVRLYRNEKEIARFGYANWWGE